MLQSFCHSLQKEQIPFVLNAPMSAHTTLRVGGPADCLVKARSTEDIQAVMHASKKAQIPLLFIGNGSNLLISDGGIRGCVVVIGSDMASISHEGTTLHAQAGASLGGVAQVALSKGLSGMEALSGIPGTIGGAAYMNAGAYDHEMSAIVQSVEALDDSGQLVTLPKDALAYGYRTSILMQKNWVIVRVSLSLTPKDAQDITAGMQSYAAQRREKQPLSMPSAGSFFKRPEGHYAGALIAQAGLKGVSIGGAQVSEMHAGFLVNTGSATAKDFLDLMAFIQERVQQMSGVYLEPEVKILGCNSSC